MIQIERVGNKFRVSAIEDIFGSFSSLAATAAEAAQAVRHYYDDREGCSPTSCVFCADAVHEDAEALAAA